MRCCCLRSNFTAVVLAVVAVTGGVFAIAAGLPDKTAEQAAPPAKPVDKPATPPTAAPTDRPDKPVAAKPAADKMVGDPYPLDTCPVSGEKLDAKAVAFVNDGREIKFCCAKCVTAFKADPAKYLAEVDKKIVAAQKPFYPLKACVVMPDDELVDGDAVDMVWNNRLVRFCCKGCIKKFNADPAKFTATIDAAVIAAQKPTYKLATCPISGEKLGSMGAPVEMVINNRLVKLCCKGCEAAVKKNPTAVFAKLDAAK